MPRKEFDRLQEVMASHKAAALIRSARNITWDADVATLQWLGIKPALRLEGDEGKRAELLDALYRGRVGIRRGAKDAPTHFAIETSEGTKIATLDMPNGYTLP
jgi:hypothetical protein